MAETGTSSPVRRRIDAGFPVGEGVVTAFPWPHSEVVRKIDGRVKQNIERERGPVKQTPALILALTCDKRYPELDPSAVVGRRADDFFLNTMSGDLDVTHEARIRQHAGE
jgi:hypothetical protein